MTLSPVELRSVNGAPVMDHGTTGARSFLPLSKRFPLCSLIYEACLRNSTICTFIHRPRLGRDRSTFGLFEAQVLVSLLKLQIIDTSKSSEA